MSKVRKAGSSIVSKNSKEAKEIEATHGFIASEKAKAAAAKKRESPGEDSREAVK